MKIWQVILSVLVLAAVGWSVVLNPPGEHTVRVDMAVVPVPTPAPQPLPGPVTLLFAGDVMLSRSVGDVMAARNDWTWPFAAIASVTRAADLFFVNLESVLSDQGAVGGCAYCFRADPRALAGLRHAGVDVVSAANNHAGDFGLAAFQESLGILASGGIDVAGAGTTLAKAREPVVRTVSGTRVAYLAYTDLVPESLQASEYRAGVNRYDAVRMQQDIAQARSLADIVVVSFHTGTEYETTHAAAQERIYRSAIDAGADLVVGHHPHVVQDFERYGRGWIFYSLGNFVFDQSWSVATRTGALLQVSVDDGKIADAVLLPVGISSTYQVTLTR